MSIHELGDWVVKALAGVGFPSLLGKYIYDLIKNRESRAARRKARLENDIAEATADDRIRSSSVTSVEAQMVAMANGFQQERQAKDRTIAFQDKRIEQLEGQVADRDAQVADRDRKLAEALATIDELRQKLDELADEVRKQLHLNDE